MIEYLRTDKKPVFQLLKHDIDKRTYMKPVILSPLIQPLYQSQFPPREKDNQESPTIRCFIYYKTHNPENRVPARNDEGKEFWIVQQKNRGGRKCKLIGRDLLILGVYSLDLAH